MKITDRRVIVSEKNFKKIQVRAKKAKVSMKQVMESILKEFGL